MFISSLDSYRAKKKSLDILRALIRQITCTQAWDWSCVVLLRGVNHAAVHLQLLSAHPCIWTWAFSPYSALFQPLIGWSRQSATVTIVLTLIHVFSSTESKEAQNVQCDRGGKKGKGYFKNSQYILCCLCSFACYIVWCYTSLSYLIILILNCKGYIVIIGISNPWSLISLV